MKVIQATIENLEALAILFDGYRVFYKQTSNITAATQFLKERFVQKDATIFMAYNENNEAMGFTQLYPLFSSVSMQRTYLLNDLFVAARFRKNGVGEALMTRAKEFAISKNAKGITLETAIDNPAQHLYERLDWKKDLETLHYTWEISKPVL